MGLTTLIGKITKLYNFLETGSIVKKSLVKER